MARTFHKMHGLGNDFAIFDAREEPLAMSERLARVLADRHAGIGCDQLIVLDQSSKADVRMRIWNHDGGEVESCGNASRCVVALTGVTSIETDGGIVSGAANGSEVEVSFAEPRFTWQEVPLAYAMDTASLPLAWGELAHPTALNVGNPHLVFFVDDEQSIPLDGLGPLIEHDPAFPERINVNVANLGEDGIRLRTWERGAGLTLACGTGACASAVAAIVSRRASSPVQVKMPGGSLTIAWAPGEPIRMRGAATYVYQGEIDLEALA
jgi:diaminopimelate epimerase